MKKKSSMKKDTDLAGKGEKEGTPSGRTFRKDALKKKGGGETIQPKRGEKKTSRSRKKIRNGRGRKKRIDQAKLERTKVGEKRLHPPPNAQEEKTVVM